MMMWISIGLFLATIVLSEILRPKSPYKQPEMSDWKFKSPGVHSRGPIEPITKTVKISKRSKATIVTGYKYKLPADPLNTDPRYLTKADRRAIHLSMEPIERMPNIVWYGKPKYDGEELDRANPYRIDE
jgi:hypothetical protein